MKEALVDRTRIIEKLRTTPIVSGSATFRFKRELGRGGNGVAILCSTSAGEETVAKVYVPPDARDLDDRALERFNNEVTLTTRFKHPHIVPSLGSGAIDIGTYRLPFYLMPVASSTLRAAVSVDTDAEQIERKVKLFLRACYGVACLHHYGVVHRDLKPENILVDKKGEPWVADLGIAHVNPDFVSVGLKTIASEKLLNRDYYAPEQRFGQATEVDFRADVYALGCILYELLTSIPPVRTNSPNPSSISSVLAPFDSIWSRMAAWKKEERYAAVEYAAEDISMALGHVLAVLRGASGVRHPDVKLMTKLMRSRNEAQRQQGIEIAIRLGKSALADLHALLGHGKREVRNSAAQAIGQIAEPSSLPFLVAALYGNTEKVGHFRPAADTAAEAIARYPVDDRINALRLIESHVLPAQLRAIVAGLPADAAYEAVLDLKKRDLLLLDYADTELSLLSQIDEARAWPDVERLLLTGSDYKIRQVLRYVTPEHKLELVKGWVRRGTQYVWYFRDMIEVVLELEIGGSEKDALLEMIEMHLKLHSGRVENRSQLLTMIRKARSGSKSSDISS